MSNQFTPAFKEYEDRLRYYSSSIEELSDAFEAGRALGRREMKGEALAEAEYYGNQEVVAAIEAIPEEGA